MCLLVPYFNWRTHINYVSKKIESEVHWLLGLEDADIVKIRAISILLSVAFESVLVLYLEAHSSIFNLMYYVETNSIVHDVHHDHYKSLFMVLPALALLVNLITKLYALWINRKMSCTINIFTFHCKAQQTNHFSNEELFSVSLEAALGIPLWMIVAIAASFANRKWILIFFIPFQLMLINLLFPIFIISKNKKMRNSLIGSVQEQFNKMLTSVKEQFNKVWTLLKRQITNNVTPEYVLPQ